MEDKWNEYYENSMIINSKSSIIMKVFFCLSQTFPYIKANAELQ